MQKLLRLPAVIDRSGLPRTTIYEMMGTGDFPRSIKLGARSVAWVEAEINDWIRARIDVSREKGLVQKD